MSKRLAALGCLGALGLALSTADCLFDYAGAERCAHGSGGGCPDATTSSGTAMTSSSSSMPASCQDHEQNEGESDEDCGGDAGCPRCAPGKHCFTGSDCDSAVCDKGRCAEVKYTTLWSPITGGGTHPPPGRFGAGVTALDGGTILIHGGYTDPDSGVDFNDTWRLDGKEWSQLATAGATVHYTSMAFDEGLGRAVAVGGVTKSGAPKGSSYLYDPVADAWSAGPALPNDETRYGATLLDLGGHLTLFGGVLNGASATSELRELTLVDGGPPIWASKTPVCCGDMSKVARYYHAAAYDSIHDLMIVFGGEEANSVGGTLGDTWSYSRSELAWNKLSTTKPPSPRYGAAMAFDPIRKVVVLYGGEDHEPPNGHTLRDTWELSEHEGQFTWTQIPVYLPSPKQARGFAAMAYDNLRQRIVLFSGAEGTTRIFGTYAYTAYGGPCPPNDACVNGYCVDGVCCLNPSCSEGDACNTPATPGLCAPDPDAGM